MEIKVKLILMGKGGTILLGLLLFHLNLCHMMWDHSKQYLGLLVDKTHRALLSVNKDGR